MTSAERNVAIATTGLALTALGVLLPWARIGGRNRSGIATADTFIALADGALPDTIAWIGRWWYVPAVLAIAAWASTFASGRRSIRSFGILLVLTSVSMWWLFIWAGARYDVLTIRLAGPVVATVGLAAIGFACSRDRLSMLHPGRQ